MVNHHEKWIECELVDGVNLVLFLVDCIVVLWLRLSMMWNVDEGIIRKMLANYG